MWETYTLLAKKIKQYIDLDEDRDKRLDNLIGAVIVIGLFMLAYGIADLINGPDPGDPVKAPKVVVVTNEAGVKIEASTTITVPEQVLPTGEAAGPKVTQAVAKLPLADELPKGATSEAFKKLGPFKPVAISPLGGATVRSLAPLLKWQKSKGASFYYAEIAKTPDVDKRGYFEEPVSLDPLISETSWRAPAIAESGTYYWHVAVGTKGRYLPTFGPSYKITILASPTVNGPSGGQEVGQDELNFRWDELDGASTYQIDVATDTAGADSQRGFTTFVLREEYIKATSFKPVRPLKPGTYYWHVRGIDASKARGEYSDIHKVVVK